MLWGPENKEQSQLREPGTCYHIVWMETAMRGGVEKGRVSCGPAEKFKQ
jgi:hypothetical protein